MYHVSAQGIDERMINVHYYYYSACRWSVIRGLSGVVRSGGQSYMDSLE